MPGHTRQPESRKLANRLSLPSAISGNDDMLRVILESTLNIICWKDKEGRYLGCNRAFLLARGYDNFNDVIGKTVSEIAFDPEESEVVAAADAAVFKSGKPALNYEEQIHHADGSSISLLSNKVPMTDDDGEVIGLISIGTDISEHKAAEAQLAKSEQRFRDLIEGSIQGVFVHRGFKPLFVNQSAASMFGFETPAEVMELDSVLPLVADEDRERVEEYGRKRIRGEPVPDHYEMRAFRKNGQSFWVEHRVRVVEWDGEAAVQSTVVEITERKNGEAALLEARDTLEQKVEERTRALADEIAERKAAEAKLRASEEKYRQLVDGMLDGVFVSTEGKYTFVNQGFARMVGCSVEEMTGQPIDKFVAKRDRKLILDRHHARLEGHDVVPSYEFNLLAKDGKTEIPVLVNVVRIPGPDGTPALLGTLKDITEQKKVENALRENTELLRAFIDNSDATINLKDRDRRVLLVNEKYSKLFGIDPEGFIGKQVHEVLDDQEVIRTTNKADKKILKTGESQHYEINLTVGGEQQTHFINKFPVTDKDGKVIRIGTFGTDITEQKRVENALRESGELLRALVDNSGMTINLKDRNGRILLANKKYQEFRGAKAGQLIGKETPEIVDDREIVERVAEAEARIYVTGKPVSYEYEILVNGQRQVRFVNKFPVFDAEGHINRIGTFGTNITKQKQIEEALRGSENKLRAILDNVPACFTVKDLHGKLTMVNPEFASQAGLSEDSAAGKNVFDYLPRDAAARVAKCEKEVITTGKVQTLEVVFKHANEQRDRIHHVTLFPMFDDDGNVVMVGSFGIDVSEQKETEKALVEVRDELEARVYERTRALEQEIFERKYAQAELIKANDELERRVEERTRHLKDEVAERKRFEAQLVQAQKMEAVGQMAGGIAHDFNNLLTVVLANLGWLQDFAENDPKAKRMTGLALEGARRAGELTQRMLAFSRRQELQPVTIDLSKTLDSFHPLISRTLGETISFEMSLAPNLWPVSIDPNQFESSILNIAINARDAMIDGGKFTVDVRNRPAKSGRGQTIDNKSGDAVEIRLTDTGCGIPPETLRRVFDPFFTTKEVGRGSGLGLSMVFGFAKQSGGFVEIDSTEGKGTTVCLVLPRADDVKPIGGNAQKEEHETVETDGMRILVVEDDEMVRNVTVEYLKMAGISVSSAENADFALHALENDGPVDLVISDVIMPGTSGVELASTLKRKWPDTRVVLMTGYSYDEFSRRGIDPQSMKLLRKPFSRAELLDTINEAMQ